MPSELLTIAAGILGFLAGVAADWSRQWSANWFARRAVRGALRAEIAALAVNLNFYILRAGFRPGAFDFYWNERRETLLKLPEWSRLRSWYGSLAAIGSGEHPPLFGAIMLFESLLIAPLDKCLDRGTAVVVKSTLGRADVEAYKVAYLLR